ncbi:hypothetical protein ACIGZJ_20785 [Kitasatospora sp. NPDC052868]|uniref:hypothetical protein n=1 Tax=Kitasatospora sp. NPDC052868 TaxID=3364060 RepID=UPI0037C78CB0
MKVREPGGARGGGGPAGERTPGDSWPALQGRPVLRRSIAVGLVLCVAFMGVLLVRGVNALTLGRPVPETDRDRAELLAGLHPSQHPGAGRYYVPVGAVYTHTPDGVPVAYLHYRLGSGRPVDVADFLRTYDLPAPGPLAPLPTDLTAALGGDEPAEASELPEVGTAWTPSPSPSPSLASSPAESRWASTAPSASPSQSQSPSLVEPPAPTPGPMASPAATVPSDPQPSPSSPSSPSSPEASPSPSDPCTASARPTGGSGESGESAEGDDEGDEEGGGEEAAQAPSPIPTASAPQDQDQGQAQAQAPVLVPAAAVAEPEPAPTAAPSPTVTPSPTATPSPTVIRTPTAGRRIYVATTSSGLTGATDIYVRASG